MIRSREGLYLSLPGLALFSVFILGPLLMSGIGSVYEFGYYGRGFIGLDAYRSVLSSARFWQSFRTTLLMTGLILPASMLLSISVSIVLSWASSRIQSIGRFLFHVPSVASIMMLSLVWRIILAPSGLLNKILQTDIEWLAVRPYPLIIICVITTLTGLGGVIIYTMAAFLSVDESIIEAARLDGCSPLQEAWYITLPITTPILIYLGITRLVGLLQIWQVPYAVTGGGPNYATTTIMLYTYDAAFTGNNVPEATLTSFLLILSAIIPVLLYKITTKQRVLT